MRTFKYGFGDMNLRTEPKVKILNKKIQERYLQKLINERKVSIFEAKLNS